MIDFNSDQFIASLKKREHKAVSILITEYQPSLIKGALASKMSMEQAEDVVAETWGVFFEKANNFLGQSQIKTYLFGIMYNKIREATRKSDRYVGVDDPSDTLASNFNEKGMWSYTPTAPDSFIKAVELRNKLDKCLDELTENQRRAFYLKEIEGEKPEDICKEVGISMSNFKVTLHRARNQIRRCVEAKYA